MMNTNSLSVNSEKSLPENSTFLNIVENADGVQTISARELYKGLEISKRFSEWFLVNSKDFVENVDFTSVLTSTVVNNGAKRDLKDYAISIDMAKSICLMSHTEQGRKYRQYLIQLEKAWNTPEAVMARALQIANRHLENANKIIEIQSNKLIQQQPKVDFYDDVTGSSDTKDMAEVCKILNFGFGRTKLFELLRNKKVLDCSNQPYQKYVDAGYFRIIESKYTLPNGDVKINLKTVVFQKGIDFIRRMVIGLSDNEIKRYRNKLADKNYINKAIEDVADKFLDWKAE